MSDNAVLKGKPDIIIMSSSIVPSEFFDAKGLPSIIIEYNSADNDGKSFAEAINVDKILNNEHTVEYDSKNDILTIKEGAKIHFTAKVCTCNRELQGAGARQIGGQPVGEASKKKFVEAINFKGNNSRCFRNDVTAVYDKFKKGKKGNDHRLTQAFDHVKYFVAKFKEEFDREPAEFDLILCKYNDLKCRVVTTVGESNIMHVALISGVIRNSAGEIIDLTIVEMAPNTKHFSNGSFARNILLHSEKMGDIYVIPINDQIISERNSRSDIFNDVVKHFLPDKIHYNFSQFLIHPVRKILQKAGNGLAHEFARHRDGSHSYTCVQQVFAIFKQARFLDRSLHTAEIGNYNLLFVDKSGNIHENGSELADHDFLFSRNGMQVSSIEDGINLSKSSIFPVSVESCQSKFSSTVMVNNIEPLASLAESNGVPDTKPLIR